MRRASIWFWLYVNCLLLDMRSCGATAKRVLARDAKEDGFVCGQVGNLCAPIEIQKFVAMPHVRQVAASNCIGIASTGTITDVCNTEGRWHPCLSNCSEPPKCTELLLNEQQLIGYFDSPCNLHFTLKNFSIIHDIPVNRLSHQQIDDSRCADLPQLNLFV